MIPYISRSQAAELDRLMVEHFHVPVLVMMELAGYRLAEFIRMVVPDAKDILIVVGKGNNGGDGIAAARHLLNFGYDPSLYLVQKELGSLSGKQLLMAEAAGVPVPEDLDFGLSQADVVIDCMIGYGLAGEPRGRYRQVIDALNVSGRQIVACDIPTGIDADHGRIYGSCIKASHTLALSLPKKGSKGIGKIWVADIGVPRALYPMIGVAAEDYFREAQVRCL